jgi:hypothetical protein
MMGVAMKTRKHFIAAAGQVACIGNLPWNSEATTGRARSKANGRPGSGLPIPKPTPEQLPKTAPSIFDTFQFALKMV